MKNTCILNAMESLVCLEDELIHLRHDGLDPALAARALSVLSELRIELKAADLPTYYHKEDV